MKPRGEYPRCSEPVMDLAGAGNENAARWVVERTFAWTAQFRLLARDDERSAHSVAGLHFQAFACLLLQHFMSLLAESQKKPLHGSPWADLVPWLPLTVPRPAMLLTARYARPYGHFFRLSRGSLREGRPNLVLMSQDLSHNARDASTVGDLLWTMAAPTSCCTAFRL
jgi:hypothetical protein